MPNSPLSNHSPEIPGYELLEKIGEGGMGEVFRARQLQPSRKVAIKFLTHLPHPPAPGPARVLRESLLMALLTHPNVVTVHDCGEIEGRFYLVMEYIAGSNLRSMMKPGEPWPANRAVSVLDAVARALTYMHDQDILHLDLKPENVLCDGDGVVKITDFGLALSLVEAGILSEMGSAQGTMDYCSPEQRYGLPIDQRSDLFSLAALAYELLTGQIPGRVYVPCSSRNPELSPAIDNVLARGLARDRDERYPAVEPFRRDLIESLQR